MAGVVGKYAAKKVLGSQMDKYRSKKVAGDDDPYFALVPGRRGKMKKVKKQIPDFIPEHDAKCLASAKNLAYKMDMALFSFAGIRFGWGSVIGIVPTLGDVFDLFFALMVYRRCKAVEGGLPASIQSRMTLNIVIDFVIGIIPFIGDIADAVYRCNTKNVMLLERHLKKKYGPDDSKAQAMAGLELFEDDSDQELGQTGVASSGGVVSSGPSGPSAGSGGGKSGPYGGGQKGPSGVGGGGSGGQKGGHRTREPDVEMGLRH